LEAIDITGEYSDDDEEIYFTEKELREYLFKIEEDNLFNFNLYQSDKEQLDNQRKAT